MAANVSAHLAAVLFALSCNPNPQLQPDTPAVDALLELCTADELAEAQDLAVRLTNVIDEALQVAGSRIANADRRRR